jgi:RNA polymerase sigma-70 factor (ECF subfamily)
MSEPTRAPAKTVGPNEYALAVPARDGTERLWRDHHAELRAFLRRRVADPGLAEDLLQTVFLKAHAGLGSLADPSRGRPWLYRIARNAVIDHLRSRRAAEPLGDDLLEVAAQENGPEPGLERCVRPMLAQMPARYREAVRLADLEGLPLLAVAERLGLSLSGAKSRVQRGRAMLGRCFDECCELELDGRGRPISWTARQRCCTTTSCATLDCTAVPCAVASGAAARRG